MTTEQIARVRKQRVLIADDHPLFRDGLKAAIERHAHMMVVGEAADGSACIAQFDVIEPDAVIVDLSMPRQSGFAVLQHIMEQRPTVLCLIMSMDSSSALVAAARARGARGFLAKEDAGEEVAAALNTPPGSFYISSHVGAAQPVMPVGGDVEAKLRILTPAQHQILRLVAQSMTSREIADALGLSPRTVQTHRNNIARKLGLEGSNALLKFAIEHQKHLI